MKLRYEHNKCFHDTWLVYLGNDQKRDFFRDFHKRDKLCIKSATFYPVIRITEITLINRNNPKWHRNNFFIDLFLYEMIKYQLNITLYEKISLYNSIRFDISLSQACCSGIT